MTPIIAALVLTNLLYVVVPVAVAAVVSGLYVMRHHKPESVESGIESFNRELRALAPERRAAEPTLDRLPTDDGAGGALGSPSG